MTYECNHCGWTGDYVSICRGRDEAGYRVTACPRCGSQELSETTKEPEHEVR